MPKWRQWYCTHSTASTSKTVSYSPLAALQDAEQAQGRRTNKLPRTPVLRIGGTTSFRPAVCQNRTLREGMLVGLGGGLEPGSGRELREFVEPVNVVSVPVLEVLVGQGRF